MAQRRGIDRIARNGFKRIASTLEQRIARGELSPGRFLPTERELQEEFGASRSTIRRALAHLIEAGWAENVPSKGVVAGKTAHRSTSRTVALVDGASYVLRVLFIKLSDQLRENGLHLVHLGGHNDGSMEAPLEYAMQQDLAGLIVWPFRGFPDESVVRRAAKQMPLVFLDHGAGEVDTDIVTFDYVGAADIATEHLIAQGAKRIGVTGMIDMLDVSHQRMSGYMRAMFRCGLQPASRDFVFIHTSGMAQPDLDPLIERLSRPDRPDALLVMQDEFMPHVVEAALTAGLRLPEDLRLVTIGDDIDLSVGDYGLTAVALDWDRMAKTTLDLLLQRLAGSQEPTKRLLAPYRLIVRGLCGAPRKQWTPDPDRLTGFVGELPFPRSQFRFPVPRPDPMAGP